MIGGATQERQHWDEEQVHAALDELLAQGVSRPVAARRVAAASGWRRADVYALGLRDK